METIGRETSNMAAFGWDWTQDGIVWQLSNPRGTRALMLGRRTAGNGWDTLVVSNVDRFLTDNPPATRKEWRAVVDRWFASSEEAP